MPTGANTLARLSGDTPLRFEVVEDQADFPPAADHAHVAGATIDQMIQRLFVVVVPASHDQRIGVRRDFELGQRRADVAGNAAAAARGNRSASDILGPIVDHPHVEAEVRQPGSPTAWPMCPPPTMSSRQRARMRQIGNAATACGAHGSCSAKRVAQRRRQLPFDRRCVALAQQLALRIDQVTGWRPSDRSSRRRIRSPRCSLARGRLIAEIDRSIPYRSRARSARPAPASGRRRSAHRPSRNRCRAGTAQISALPAVERRPAPDA